MGKTVSQRLPPVGSVVMTKAFNSVCAPYLYMRVDRLPTTKRPEYVCVDTAGYTYFLPRKAFMVISRP